MRPADGAMASRPGATVWSDGRGGWRGEYGGLGQGVCFPFDLLPTKKGEAVTPGAPMGLLDAFALRRW